MENTLTELTFVKEIIVPKCFTVTLFDQDVIDVAWYHDIKEVTKRHIVLLRDKIRELGNGKKMLIYISTIDFLTISAEARKYSASDEGGEFTFANAVLIDSLPKKLIFNFFLRMNRPKILTRAFMTRDDAIQWLLAQKR
jgi:hypothetical protein